MYFPLLVRHLSGWEKQRKNFRWQISDGLAIVKTMLIFEPVSTHKYADAYLVAPCSCSVFPGRGGGGGEASRAWESGNRARLKQSTIAACVSRENTSPLLEGPLSSWHHLEKENIAVCPQGFLRSRGPGFGLVGGIAWEWRGMGKGAWAPLLCSSSAPSLGLTFAPLAGRASLVEACPFGPGRRTNARAGWAGLLFLALSVAVVLKIYTGSKTAPLSPVMPWAVEPYPSWMASPLLG